eukprot:m.258807 g.258807  ORF g.258807 m.258807 type:complete len:151 (-) comp15548_c2_seq14:800-1252(-)
MNDCKRSNEHVSCNKLTPESNTHPATNSCMCNYGSSQATCLQATTSLTLYSHAPTPYLTQGTLCSVSGFCTENPVAVAIQTNRGKTYPHNTLYIVRVDSTISQSSLFDNDVSYCLTQHTNTRCWIRYLLKSSSLSVHLFTFLRSLAKRSR